MWWQMFVVQSNTRGIKRNAWINGISKERKRALRSHSMYGFRRIVRMEKKRKEEEREWVRGEGGGEEGGETPICASVHANIGSYRRYNDILSMLLRTHRYRYMYIHWEGLCVCACVRASLVTSRYACRMLVLDRRCEARPSNSHFLSRLENNFAMILKVRARISDIAT